LCKSMMKNHQCLYSFVVPTNVPWQLLTSIANIIFLWIILTFLKLKQFFLKFIVHLQDWCPTLLKLTKSYTWKHAHKSPPKPKPHFHWTRFQPQITNYKKLMSCNKYLTTIMCYKIDTKLLNLWSNGT
jgi:hypothetical protein